MVRQLFGCTPHSGRGLGAASGSVQVEQYKNNNQKTQNKPHISVRMKMRNGESCIWKNPPARDKHSSTAAGERREESKEGGRGGREMEQETFPLVLLLTSSQKNALIKQPCWPSCNSASTLQRQVRRRTQKYLSESVRFQNKSSRKYIIISKPV